MDQNTDELEAFLQKAEAFQTSRTTKTSILAPYCDRIMFAYEKGIKLTTILKTLEGEGIKTSYDNLRAYVFRQCRDQQKVASKK